MVETLHMNTSFTNEYLPSKIDEIVGFLMGPRLLIPNRDYPDILDWFQKVWQQLHSQEKRALIALEGETVAGVVIYQRHKLVPLALEIKNLTVRPESAGRKYASLLMRNAEIEGARDFGSRKVLCDAKRDNTAVRMFLASQGYLLADVRDLYKKGAGVDSVFAKAIMPSFPLP